MIKKTKHTNKKRTLRKMGALILAGVMLMSILSGCSLFKKEYNVEYDVKDAYEGAKDSYRAGTRVKLIYPMIATDTDYTFTVTGKDGTVISQEPSAFGEIIFIMPEQDVVIETISRNSMAMKVD